MEQQPWALLFLLFQLPVLALQACQDFSMTLLLLFYIWVLRGGMGMVRPLEWEFVKVRGQTTVWDLVYSFLVSSEIELGSSSLAANAFTFWAILKAHTCFCGGWQTAPQTHSCWALNSVLVLVLYRLSAVLRVHPTSVLQWFINILLWLIFVLLHLFALTDVFELSSLSQVWLVLLLSNHSNDC